MERYELASEAISDELGSLHVQRGVAQHEA